MVQKVLHGGAVGQATKRAGEAVADQAHRDGAEHSKYQEGFLWMKRKRRGHRIGKRLRRYLSGSERLSPLLK